MNTPSNTSPSTTPVEHPYASFVHRVQKPARYVGGEYGSRKKDWDSVDARVCLAFPDVYDIGMSHLGFKILYGILNDHPRTLAERCYTPWIDMEAELRTRGVALLSLESARPLSDFDVVGFSLQFELTYTNVLTMLDLGGIPLRSADRGEDAPLIIAGGPTATHPEPLAIFPSGRRRSLRSRQYTVLPNAPASRTAKPNTSRRGINQRSREARRSLSTAADMAPAAMRSPRAAAPACHSPAAKATRAQMVACVTA